MTEGGGSGGLKEGDLNAGSMLEGGITGRWDGRRVGAKEPRTAGGGGEGNWGEVVEVVERTYKANTQNTN